MRPVGSSPFFDIKDSGFERTSFLSAFPFLHPREKLWYVAYRISRPLLVFPIDFASLLLFLTCHFSYGHTAAMEKFPVRHGVPRWPQPSFLLCEMGVVPGPDNGAEGWESLCKASDTALGRSVSESPLAWLLCSKTVLGERRKPTQSPPAQIWIWAALHASSQTLSRLLSFAHWITLAFYRKSVDSVCVGLLLDSILLHWSLCMLTPQCLKIRSDEAPNFVVLSEK